MAACLEMSQKFLLAEHVATMCFDAQTLAQLSRPCSRLHLGRLCSHFVALWQSSRQCGATHWWEFEDFCVRRIVDMASGLGRVDERDPTVLWFLSHWDRLDQIELRLHAYLTSRLEMSAEPAPDAAHCGYARVPELTDLEPF